MISVRGITRALAYFTGKKDDYEANIIVCSCAGDGSWIDAGAGICGK
jgi:hypothetical protein